MYSGMMPENPLAQTPGGALALKPKEEIGIGLLSSLDGSSSTRKKSRKKKKRSNGSKRPRRKKVEVSIDGAAAPSRDIEGLAIDLPRMREQLAEERHQRLADAAKEKAQRTLLDQLSPTQVVGSACDDAVGDEEHKEQELMDGAGADEHQLHKREPAQISETNQEEEEEGGGEGEGEEKANKPEAQAMTEEEQLDDDNTDLSSISDDSEYQPSRVVTAVELPQVQYVDGTRERSKSEQLGLSSPTRETVDARVQRAPKLGRARSESAAARTEAAIAQDLIKSILVMRQSVENHDDDDDDDVAAAVGVTRERATREDVQTAVSGERPQRGLPPPPNDESPLQSQDDSSNAFVLDDRPQRGLPPPPNDESPLQSQDEAVDEDSDFAFGGDSTSSVDEFEVEKLMAERRKQDEAAIDEIRESKAMSEARLHYVPFADDEAKEMEQARQSYVSLLADDQSNTVAAESVSPRKKIISPRKQIISPRKQIISPRKKGSRKKRRLKKKAMSTDDDDADDADPLEAKAKAVYDAENQATAAAVADAVAAADAKRVAREQIAQRAANVIAAAAAVEKHPSGEEDVLSGGRGDTKDEEFEFGGGGGESGDSEGVLLEKMMDERREQEEGQLHEEAKKNYESLFDLAEAPKTAPKTKKKKKKKGSILRRRTRESNKN